MTNLSPLFTSLFITAGLTLTPNKLTVPAQKSVTPNFEKVLAEIPLETKLEEEESKKLPPISKHHILKDRSQRLPKEFDIPRGLYRRTSFWLSIYSRYTSSQKVIHHKDFPWIIYQVVDIKDLKDSKLRQWQKNSILERRSWKARAEIRAMLIQLSEKSDYKSLSRKERQLFHFFQKIPGKRQDVFSQASRRVRIQTGQKDYFQSGLINSQRYLPEMEKIFINHGLPSELTRLPLVESSFNERATSFVGARGVWQIMPLTGKDYFHVSKNFDERRSPLKSTHVAAKILKSHFKRFQRWPLAVTAYNHGAGGISQGLRQTKEKTLFGLILKDKRRAFGFASQNFYSEFLAALYAEKYKDKLFGQLPTPKALSITELPIETEQPLSTKRLAVLSQLSEEQLVRYNLDLKASVKKSLFLPKNYRVILPKKHAQVLQKNLEFLKARNLSVH